MSEYFPSTEEIEAGRLITPGQAIRWLEETERQDGYFDGKPTHVPLRYFPDLERAAFISNNGTRLLPEDTRATERPDRAWGFPCSFWTVED